jgi:hypothetical protein
MWQNRELKQPNNFFLAELCEPKVAELWELPHETIMFEWVHYA